MQELLMKILPWLLCAGFTAVAGKKWRHWIHVLKEIGDVFEAIHKANEDNKITPAETKIIIHEAIEAWKVIQSGKKGRVA